MTAKGAGAQRGLTITITPYKVGITLGGLEERLLHVHSHFRSPYLRDANGLFTLADCIGIVHSASRAFDIRHLTIWAADHGVDPIYSAACMYTLLIKDSQIILCVFLHILFTQRITGESTMIHNVLDI